jgi:hypothetical protein
MRATSSVVVVVIMLGGLVEVPNSFEALEDLGADVNIFIVWETMRENIKISAKECLGYYELKKVKPWSDKGCSDILDQRKQVKLQ